MSAITGRDVSGDMSTIMGRDVKQSQRSAKKRLLPSKPVSKAHTVKKLLNKKIKLNTHVRFDEEGEEVSDDTTITARKRYEDLEDDSGVSDSAESITPVPLVEYEAGMGNMARVGGIEIGKAQQRILARDRIDRQFERERVRQVHQERRLKGKRQHSETKDTGAVSLPLPPEASDEDTPASSDESEEEDLPSHVVKRRKAEPKGRTKRSREQLGTDVEAELQDDEQLARHLLGII